MKSAPYARTSSRSQVSVRAARDYSLLRLLIWRLTLAASLFVAGTFIVLDRLESDFIRQARLSIFNVSAPLAAYLEKPAALLQDQRVYFQSQIALRDENSRYRERLAQVEFLELENLLLREENLKLKEHLNFSSEQESDFSTVKVLSHGGRTSASWVILLNPEVRKRFQSGNTVVDPSGALVGQLYLAKGQHAEVITLYSNLSRIPIQLENGEQATLAGVNGNKLRFMYHSESFTPQIGEKIYTSGEGGTLARGIYVGTIQQVSKEHDSYLVDLGLSEKFLGQAQALKYVRVLHF